MPQQINKKFFIFLLLFLFLGTITNKNLNQTKFLKVNHINVSGLDNLENNKILEDLKFLKNQNIFLINKKKIFELMNSNNLIETYSVFKKYPSTIELEVKETNYLALLSKNGKNYFFGSNGKLIEVKYDDSELPFIYGNFKKKDFFELKEILEIFQFEFRNIKNLFYFPSGRWDIEMKSGILIKLPKKKLKDSIELSLKILKENSFQNIKTLDLRQNNLIIVNE